MNFGEKVKLLRTEKEWTQQQLADKVGVSKRTVIYYEKNGGYPKQRDVYYKLAEVLGVDVNYLLTETEEFMDAVGTEFGRRGQLQAQELLSQTSQLFAGGTLSNEDMIDYITEVQQIFFRAKRKERNQVTTQDKNPANGKAE